MLRAASRQHNAAKWGSRSMGGSSGQREFCPLHSTRSLVEVMKNWLPRIRLRTIFLLTICAAAGLAIGTPPQGDDEAWLGTAAAFRARLREQGMWMNATAPPCVRAATHHDVSRERMQHAAKLLQETAAAVDSIAR